MTFRSEITNILHENCEIGSIQYCDLCQFKTQRIITIFEKRIDVLKQRLEELKNPKDNIDPLKDYHCYTACIKTLDKLKEMLK